MEPGAPRKLFIFYEAVTARIAARVSGVLQELSGLNLAEISCSVKNKSCSSVKTEVSSDGEREFDAIISSSFLMMIHGCAYGCACKQ